LCLEDSVQANVGSSLGRGHDVSPRLCTGELNDLGKCFRIARSQIGKNFSVDGDFFLIERRYQTGLRGTMYSRGSINSRNPELSKRTFLQAPITIGMLSRFVNVVFCYREDLAPGTPIAFCTREDALAAAMGGNFIL
jgi:hypothetical protein